MSIGLDHYLAGISTDSARGPETTGNNRHHSDNADTKTGHATPEWGGSPSVLRSRKTAGQIYRTGSPVTARPMIIRWISLVPSKIVKIVDWTAVSAGSRLVWSLGISTDSAHVHSCLAGNRMMLVPAGESGDFPRCSHRPGQDEVTEAGREPLDLRQAQGAGQGCGQRTHRMTGHPGKQDLLTGRSPRHRMPP